MKKFNCIFALILIMVITSYPQKDKELINVAPYQPVMLPQMPLVYFPVSSLSFDKSKIKITDEKGTNVTQDRNIVEIIEAKVYKVNSRGNNNNELTSVSFGSSISTNGRAGYPAGCYARLLFKKPGNKYTIQFSPTASGSPPDVVFPLEHFGGDRILYGKKEMTVYVGFPKINLKQLKEKYFYNDSESFDFYSAVFEDESLYMHKIFVNGKEVQTLKGYRVVLDPIFTNLDYNESDIEIACYYDNNLIKLSPTEEARRKTRFEADFSKTGYEPKDKWKNNPEDAVTISLSNPDNLLFNFFYVFGEGSQRKEIPPFEGSAPGGGIPTVTLNDDFGNGLEFVPVNNWKTIKLNPQDFEKIKPNSVVKLEFNFIDQKTKKAFNYKLFCIKK